MIDSSLSHPVPTELFRCELDLADARVSILPVVQQSHGTVEIREPGVFFECRCEGELGMY